MKDGNRRKRVSEYVTWFHASGNESKSIIVSSTVFDLLLRKDKEIEELQKQAACFHGHMEYDSMGRACGSCEDCNYERNSK